MRYASIRELDISNGEGVGVALFVQGCRFACKNCFNPNTWDFNGGKEWRQDVKEKFLELIDRPYIKRVSIRGGEPLADENIDGVLDLVTEINKRYNIPQDIVCNNNSDRNILNENSDEIRLSLPNKSIWLYTGYTWDQIFTDGVFLTRDCAGWKRREIVKQCNILVDGRYIDSERDITLKWKGSRNQRVIDVQRSLQQNRIVLYCD